MSTLNDDGTSADVQERGELSHHRASVERAAKKKKRRRHRSQYPTPEFYFFAFFLNLAAVIVAALMLPENPINIPLLITGILGVLGLIISVYSITLRPKSSNRRLRVTLVSLTAIYGFVLLAAHAVNILITPANFTLPFQL